MFIFTAFLAQLHASYGEAYDVTYHGRHTNDSSFIENSVMAVSSTCNEALNVIINSVFDRSNL